MDEMNEAFRAEIDSLNSESAHLKQMGRERDRELADQRDKVEELTGKLGIFERERNAWTNTVSIQYN
jgi:predicted nuclease with TOPRIM domain